MPDARRTAPALFLAVLAPALLAPALAQTAPTHAPDGRSFERIQSLTVLPKPGAPFSATVLTDWTRQLADGTSTTIRNHRTVARDSTGRVFQERRSFSPDGDTQPTELTELDYADPNLHRLTVCTPATRVCTVYPYFARTELPHPAAPPAASAPALAPAPTTAGVSGRMGGGGSITGGVMGGISSNAAARPTTSTEALGNRIIQNVDTVGSREIITVPAGTFGNTLPEPTVKEFWYSPRLEINLITKRFEPRGGAQNFEVKDLDLAEPDGRLFIPPAGYHVVHYDTP